MLLLLLLLLLLLPMPRCSVRAARVDDALLAVLLPLLLDLLLLETLRPRCRRDARRHEPLAAGAATQRKHHRSMAWLAS